MMESALRRTACGFAAALLLAAAASAAAETRRPSASALIAAAKATPLADFEVMEELRGLKVEAWMKKLFGATPIAWRATSCRASANVAICVEATVRLPSGVVFTLGVGFDEEAPRPERKPNTIWGAVAAGGKQCDFYRHPDQIQQGRRKIDEIVKAGRCV